MSAGPLHGGSRKYVQMIGRYQGRREQERSEGEADDSGFDFHGARHGVRFSVHQK